MTPGGFDLINNRWNNGSSPESLPHTTERSPVEGRDIKGTGQSRPVYFF